jgi:protein SCO1/2
MLRLARALFVVALAACSAPAHFDGLVLPSRAAPAFTLTDQTGQPWNLASQRGERIALYFGYTHCPDDCPMTLAKLSHAIAELGAAGRNAEIVFVTVDPRRDTPARLTSYVRHFHGARIVGLTGTPAQLQRVYAAYHVWARRAPASNPKGGYDVEHASPVFLIDANGDLRVIHDDADARSAFVHDLRALGA